jgi:hypothetical protein
MIIRAVPTPRISSRFRCFFPRCVALLALLTPTGIAFAAEDIVDPCKLVTATEAQALLGSPATLTGMRPPSRPDKRPARICSVRGQNGKSLTIYAGHQTKDKFAHESAGKESLAGIGDAAYAVPPGIIAFLKGDTSVMLQAIGLDPSEATPAFRARMKTLAVAAASRL